MARELASHMADSKKRTHVYLTTCRKRKKGEPRGIEQQFKDLRRAVKQISDRLDALEKRQ